jgi:FecR-like protein
MPYCNVNTQRIWPWAVSIALTLFSLSALAAPAAHVEFVMGNALIADRHNQTRPAEKGMALEAGDTVMTSDGRVQVRFTDGGYFSLQPQTHFRVDEYRYAGNHDEGDHVFLSLLKGGLRTISGLVGKNNRAAYRMTTTVATIGIRGTEYVLDLNATLYGHVAQGAVEVCNGAGCLLVPGGQAFSVSSPSALPVFTEKRAVLAPPPRAVAATTPLQSDKSSELTHRALDEKAKTQTPPPAKGSIADSVIPADFTLPATVVMQAANPSAGQQLGVEIGARVTESVAQNGNQARQIGTLVNVVGNQATNPVANAIGTVTAPAANTLGTAIGTTTTGVGTTLSTPLVNQAGSTLNTLPALGNGVLNGILR